MNRWSRLRTAKRSRSAVLVFGCAVAALAAGGTGCHSSENAPMPAADKDNFKGGPMPSGWKAEPGNGTIRADSLPPGAPGALPASADGK